VRLAVILAGVTGIRTSDSSRSCAEFRPVQEVEEDFAGLGRVPRRDGQARPARACRPLGGRVYLDRHPQVVEFSLRPFTGYRCKA
jgi:hypothetical protein